MYVSAPPHKCMQPCSQPRNKLQEHQQSTLGETSMADALLLHVGGRWQLRLSHTHVHMLEPQANAGHAQAEGSFCMAVIVFVGGRADCNCGATAASRSHALIPVHMARRRQAQLHTPAVPLECTGSPPAWSSMQGRGHVVTRVTCWLCKLRKQQPLSPRLQPPHGCVTKDLNAQFARHCRGVSAVAVLMRRSHLLRA